MRYNVYMASERLKNLVQDELTRLGDQSKEKLAIKAGVSVSTIRNLVNLGQIPTDKMALKLARACGQTEEEALALARGCSSERRRSTA